MATDTSQVNTGDIDAETAFYRDVLEILGASGVPVLVGGAFAMSIHTGIDRRTKDLDVFLRRADYDRAARTLRAAGYDTRLAFPHWLAKARAGSWCVDLIFDSGNGLTAVDDAWFEHAQDADVLGVPSKIMPVEEMIWSKAFIMERERYDGADVAHLLHARGRTLDWTRLVQRMGKHWRVLFAHVVLFGFIYPSERDVIPAWVMDRLRDELAREMQTRAPDVRLCQGTLLSRQQYLSDVQQQGYVDGRLRPHGNMSAEDIATWTKAIWQDGDA